MDTHHPRQGRRALVIGGSMSGLVGARVLSGAFDEVIVLERDAFPDGDVVNRAGVPQAWHHHVLLSRGRDILTGLFPGLDRRMDDAKIPTIDYGRDAALISRVGELKRFESKVMIRPCRRGTLDRLVLEELRQVPNVTIHEKARVEGLETTTDSRGRIRVVGLKVTMKDAQGKPKASILAGDLVVDASGSRSYAPKWLSQLGFDVPEEEVVDADLGYASCLYEPSPDHTRDWKVIGITTRPPTNPRAAGLWQVENGQWMCSLIGTSGHHPPSDPEGFLEFARQLPDPRIYEFLKTAKPMTKIRAYRGTKNRWRHYESMRSFPAGMVTLGTTLCSYNPLYGQGMTAVAEQALVLGEHVAKRLRSGRSFDASFARRFHKAIARTVRLPWTLATLEDWRWSTTTGKRPGAWMTVANSYIDRVLPLATHDEDVALAILNVMNMQVNPAVLGTPDMLSKYVKTFVPQMPQKRMRSQSDVPRDVYQRETLS